MWARVVSSEAGSSPREVKANYRIFLQNDTGRLAKTGENIRDICRLYDLFAFAIPGFLNSACKAKGGRKGSLTNISNSALLGDMAAARVNRKLWAELTPFRKRVMTRIRESTFYRENR